jgi:hypothetical protein
LGDKKHGKLIDARIQKGSVLLAEFNTQFYLILGTVYSLKAPNTGSPFGLPEHNYVVALDAEVNLGAAWHKRVGVRKSTPKPNVALRWRYWALESRCKELCGEGIADRSGGVHDGAEKTPCDRIFGVNGLEV